MDTIEAIHHRQSAGKMKSDSVPRDVIERLLDAAVQAPNHYKVRPWRFVVLTGNGLRQLGNVMADTFQRRFPDLPEAALEKQRNKPLRAPLIIAVGVDKPTEPKVVELENVCASAAACENILLAAEALGLGCHWRTGDAARDPAVKKFLGFSDDQQVIAFLYIGYVEGNPEPRERPGYADRTTWMEGT